MKKKSSAHTRQPIMGDFGLHCGFTKKTIAALYRSLSRVSPSRRGELVDRWQHVMCQDEVNNARAETRKKNALISLAGELGFNSWEIQPQLFLFVLHTYFALITKMLAAPVIGFAEHPPDQQNLFPWLTGLERHPIFAMPAGDSQGAALFTWYLENWTPKLADALEELLAYTRSSYVNRHNKQQLPGDILHYLYQSLFPAALRHGMGEYYTPAWLVDYSYELLAPKFFSPDGEAGLLDPACGSGAFLLPALKQLWQEGQELGFSARELIVASGRLVVGIDRNPLAVLAARVNYLLAIAAYAPGMAAHFLPPVYWGDSILAPPQELEAKEFQYIVGNPPWVNWEALPAEYREKTKQLWTEHGLFQHQGYDALLGKSKDDLSILITYVVLERYLRRGGTLAFIITQSIFQTTGAGRGFRSFQLGDGTPIQVLQVEDLSCIKPFSGAKNRTAMVLLRKGMRTCYPVPYIYWQRQPGFPAPREHDSLIKVKRQTQRLALVAKPYLPTDNASPWLTITPGVLPVIEKLQGKSYYQAREGVNTGGANGVFYFEVLARGKDGKKLLVRNITSGNKRSVPAQEAWLESDLIYPVLRGRNISPWRGVPEEWILLTHQEGKKLQAIPPEELASDYPNTFAYLESFAPILYQRRTQVVRKLMEKGFYYSLFGIGDYTFTPFKVVWHRIGTKIKAAVVGSLDVMPPQQGLIIPNDSTVFVPFTQAEEAYYFCALLNSAPAQLIVRTTSVLATGSFASPHILTKVPIPCYQSNNSLHKELAHLAKTATSVACKGENCDKWENEINKQAAALWGLSHSELGEIQRCLQQLGS
jgi:hypothetical protein